MAESDAPCARCGGETDDHFTAWAYGIPVVGSYEGAPNGRICSIEAAEHSKLSVACANLSGALKDVNTALQDARLHAGEQERRIVALRDLLFKRHSGEPQHSRTDHECAECIILYETKHKERKPCDHNWVDARNSYVSSGELCLKCFAIRAGNETVSEKMRTLFCDCGATATFPTHQPGCPLHSEYSAT
jgi:hypothetical protein